MIGSRSTEKRLIEDVLSDSSDKTRRDATHMLENLLYCDSEYEEDSAFMQVFKELASIGGIGYAIILSTEDLRTLHAHFHRKTNKIFITTSQASNYFNFT